MREFPPQRRKDRRAFTLVEVLVAEAVFLILLAVTLELVFGITQTAQGEKKRMESLGEERQSLDRLNLDWTARVRRSDIPAQFTKQAGNDQIGFLTQFPSYDGKRQLAWVSYQVGAIDQTIKGSQVVQTSALQRGMLGYNWTVSDPAPSGNPLLTFPFTPPTVTTLEPLANTVFRLEFCFLQKVPASLPSTPAYTVNSSLNLNSTNLVGIVVAVASLDQPSRQMITQQQLLALANALPRVMSDGQNPQSLWLPIVNNSAALAAAAGVPKPVASSVRVFQRILYLQE